MRDSSKEASRGSIAPPSCHLSLLSRLASLAAFGELAKDVFDDECRIGDLGVVSRVDSTVVENRAPQSRQILKVKQIAATYARLHWSTHCGFARSHAQALGVADSSCGVVPFSWRRKPTIL